MDVLTQVLEDVRLRGSVYCRSSLGTPWQLTFLAHPCAVFHVVEHGAALLEMPGRPALRLETGGFLLCTRGQAHAVSDPRSTVGARVPNILMGSDAPYRDERWCAGEPDTVLLCGTLSLERAGLLELLPEVLHVPRQPWLERVVALMALEARERRPGLETVLRRLTETLFVQVVRHHLETAPEVGGWLGGLREPRIARTLEAMHRAPHEPWTVSSLAKVARLSRSAFALNFKAAVGVAPLEYLTAWRMRVAQRLIAERVDIETVAEQSGYASAIAFHRAFKRTTGRTPGAVKRAGSAPRAPR
jgi:AraC-like DNA-binding protein